MRRRALSSTAFGVHLVSAVTAFAAASAVRHLRSRTARACVLDEADYPDEILHLDDVDNTHVGPAVALLRERYLGTAEAGSATGEDEKVLHALAAVSGLAANAARSAPSSSVVESFEYEEIIRSFVETTYVIATNLAIAELAALHESHEDCDGFYDDDITFAAVRYLTEAALTFEAENEQHLHACRACRKAGPLAPALLRARFCRDVADDMLTNQTSTHMHVHGLPIQAAYDVVEVLFETVAEIWGFSPADQVISMSGAIPSAISMAEHYRDRGNNAA